MKRGWLQVLMAVTALAWARAGLPAEVTVTAPTRFEILTNGRPGGSVAIRAGETLSVVSLAGDQLTVRYRNLTGRVPAAHTNLPRSESPAAEAVALPATAPATPATTAVVPPTTSPPVAPVRETAAVPPTSKLGKYFTGKLVMLENGGLRRRDPAGLARVEFYGIYFSAGWCGPCRRFTPELVDAYGKLRALFPEFEIVLVNRDKSPAEMAAYMREEKMPWPAMEWSEIRGSWEILRYAGSGIPCLVLVDAAGKVLSDSYRWGRYVGPDTVVDDTWKILREYRKRHPRPRS